MIGLRLGQIATGRGSLAENQLNAKKLLALAEAAATVATGGSARKKVEGEC